MKDFDNFQYFFDHINEYSDKKSIQMAEYKANGTKVSYALYEYYMSQMFYWHYVKPFGYDFLNSYIKSMTQSAKQEIQRIIDLSRIFEKDCKEAFIEMCDELNVTPDLDWVQHTIPFNWNNKSLRKSKDKIALLIAFDQFQDGTFDIERINSLICQARKAKAIHNDEIYPLRQKVYNYCKKLFGVEQVNDEINHYENTIPVTGNFHLPWKFVEFMNSLIFLYHPIEYGRHSTHPFVVKNDKSKIAMNSIKRYLERTCEKPYVHATNNRIDKLNYDKGMLECIEILHRRLCAVQDTKRSHSNPFHKKMSVHEMVHEIRKLKSTYLDFLCDCQLSQFPIVYCPENRINTDGIRADEDAFIFTIYQSYGKTTMVYENTLDKRASFIFICRNRHYDTVVPIVSEYFASEIINKRENIKRLEEKLKRRSVDFHKVLHTNFTEWRNSITKF